MKKTILMSLAVLLLTACSEEKQKFEQTVLGQMQKDQDLKDYNLDPEIMTQCVVDLTTSKMPGLFFWDPRRSEYYRGYGQLISVKQSDDPKKALAEAHEIFGSKKEALQAVMNYSESVMSCMTTLVSNSEASQVQDE